MDNGERDLFLEWVGKIIRQLIYLML